MKLVLSFLILPIVLFTQVNFVSNNIFQTDYFIENRGQFDYQQEGKRNILYSTEMPFGNVFFHKNGFSIKQKKAKPKKIHEAPEYDFAMAELKEKTIQLEWIGANPNCEIVQEQKSNHYFSFGPEEYKSYGYKKLIYKEIYPNIDILYTIEDNQKFHYSILVHKGAKVSDLKMKYHNVEADILEDEKSIEFNGTVFPIYEFGLKCNKLNQGKEQLSCHYTLKEDYISFKINDIDVVNDELEIDPWVSSTTSLTGVGNAHQKGYDVDYDSDGNLLVYGGGATSWNNNTAKPKIAKYNTSGTLLWTFNCSMAGSINWNSLSYISNFIVDKSSDKIYTGEAFNNVVGSRIIRLNSAGGYDNFISIGNSDYEECWEFQFNCSTGDIIVMGGSTKSNLNAGIINKSSGALSMTNITGVTNTYYQDILSSCIDNDAQVYAILANSSGTSLVNNYIYKLNPTINGNIWRKYSGYNSFFESDNKTYVGSNISNGFNALTANNQYLFYYDGKNLKAFQLTNGDTVGFPLSISSHTLNLQGGIESDNCNNVYIGGNDGNVLVYYFNGLNFSLVRQINISGQTGKSIYDLKANKKNNTLYISGNGFVSETVFSTCDSAVLNGSITVLNCMKKAEASISNSLGGSTYDYIWTDSTTNTIVQSKINTSHVKDTFIGNYGKTYKLTLNRNSICLPASLTKYFSFKNDTFIFTQSISKCQSYTIGNHTYTQSGTYKDTILELGCPKIVQTILTINGKTIDTIRKVLCNGDSINIRGLFIKQAGTYRDTLLAQNGCDSILVYIISISSMGMNTTHIYDSICPNQSKFFNNQTLTTAGVYNQTLKNSSGCDSIIVLHLSIKSFTLSKINATICSNSSYLFKNTMLTVSGVYYDTIFKTGGSCDSFIELNLTVNNTSTITLNQTICKGQSIKVGTMTYTSTGTYIINLKNTLNCDSIITLNLTVNDTSSTFLYQSICQGQSYPFGNNTYTASGIYTNSLKNIYNCDSIVVLSLKVHPKYFFKVKGNTCVGAPFVFYGQNYYDEGTYQKVFQSIDGCDSIYELDLSTYRIFGIEQHEFCHGDSLKINNRYVKTSGDYYDTFKLASGCDSIHLTKVKVNSWNISQVDTVLCIDDSFVYKSITYKKPTIIRDTIYSNFKTTCHKLHFIHLDFINCDTMNECQRILVPSGFSPNEDGINDKFEPIVKSDKIQILDFIVFNRWGQVVYNYFEDKKGWQGYYKGDKASAGVYNYLLKYQCKGNQFTQTGNITLLR